MVVTANTYFVADFNSLEICSVTITNRAGNVSNSSCKIFANHNQSFELYIVKILLPYSFGLDDSSKTTIGKSLSHSYCMLLSRIPYKFVKPGVCMCMHVCMHVCIVVLLSQLDQ